MVRRVTFFAEDSAEVDVVAVAERSAVRRDALATVATRVLVDAGINGAGTNTLDKRKAMVSSCSLFKAMFLQNLCK